MKTNLSGPGTRIISVLICISLLLSVAVGSVLPTVCAGVMLNAQEGGRQTPQPSSTRRKKRSATRKRVKPTASDANNITMSKQNVRAKRAAKYKTRPRQTPVASNPINSNTASSNRNTVETASANGNRAASTELSVPLNVNTNESKNSFDLNSLPLPAISTNSSTAAPVDGSKSKSRPLNREYWLLSKPNPDPELLLNKVAQFHSIVEPEKPLNTRGTLSEISDKRKVFIDAAAHGPHAKITSRLKEYGKFEIVENAKEAELAIEYYITGGPHSVGGMMTVTIRDPARRIPRIIWEREESDGGVLWRVHAYDKLIKRFIKELKKLRGEK